MKEKRLDSLLVSLSHSRVIFCCRYVSFGAGVTEAEVDVLTGVKLSFSSDMLSWRNMLDLF